VIFVLSFFFFLCVSFPIAHNNWVFKKGTESNSSSVKELWFTQRITHFDESNQRTWQQRYFVNDAYWNKDPLAPVFLMVGGEGAISSQWVTYFKFVSWAQQYDALVVCLEHRFYGKSQPFSDLGTDHLHFLSSQQALADLSNFIASFKRQHNATNAPVITFGGSYPGNLAAWFRLKFPHQTYASVASSAPVLAELDFYQYLSVVDKSMASITGAECNQRIQTATNKIEQMLQTVAGTRKLEKKCFLFVNLLSISKMHKHSWPI